MASMLRDIERGGPIEGDHILGDLLSRAAASDVHLEYGVCTCEVE